ncbi:MAG: tRNA (guanosine(37)-N1)-methyltransferase TrmD [Patescibacteria group bacterium]
MTTFHIITVLPNSFDGYLKQSIIGRAIKARKLKVKIYDLRDFVKADHAGRKTIDGRSYGGGPGMVLMAGPILRAAAKIKRLGGRQKIILLAAGGKQFTNDLARLWVDRYDHIILIAGRYEGVDDRARRILKAEEISIGPYILTGGELPALVLIDALARQAAGVLGNPDSLEEDRVASARVYTRPEVLTHAGKNHRVPKILLSGHHAKIEEWRGKQ